MDSERKYALQPKVFQSTEVFIKTPIMFQIVRLEGSFMLWVMTTPVMSDLTVSIPNRDGTVVYSSNVISSSAATISDSMSKRLAKRFNCAIYLSFNIDLEENMESVIFIERHLRNKIASILDAGKTA